MDKTDNQIFFEANKSLWDQKTKVHQESAFYDMKAFLKGKNSLQAIELEALGNVSGKKILHLQCHFGQDSLSLARMGAEVTGIDFSTESIDLARKLNDKLELNVRFIEGNVYDTDKLIKDTFDIVFTSYGVIGWLPDMNRWAKIIEKMLRPGGLFYIVEFHPLFFIFDDDSKVQYPYFNSGRFHEVVEGTYASFDANVRGDEYFWCHSLDEIMTALLAQNLQIEAFNELDYSPYKCFKNLVEKSSGKYTLNFPVRLPHLFSIKARKTYS